MENDYNDQLSSDLLSRQREGKAKLNSSGDCKSDAGTFESVNYTISTDDSAELEDTGEGSSKGADILRANPYLYNDDRPVRDAITYSKPEYEKGDEEPIVHIEELQLQSKTQQNALETLVATGPSVNKKALDPNEPTYRLEDFYKHALVIFNHTKFNHFNISERIGTENDVDVLKRTFENLGFEVTQHDDLEKDALLAEATKFSEEMDFTDYGCVAVAILTHGSNNGMLRAKDQLYSETDVINRFMSTKTTPTLVSKPKIFIIQACRGSLTSTGVTVFKPESEEILKDSVEENLQPYYILPLESDLLILHSSYPGCASHRVGTYGSWLIQTLCEKIKELSSTEHLESIIIEVKRVVAIEKGYYEYNKETNMIQNCKQMPVMTSTLIRKLYLRKFGEQASEEAYADKSRRRSASRHKVGHAESSSPMTPLPHQSEPCSCSLEHSAYMSKCLRYFVEENPTDETARYMLKVANTYEDSFQFNKSKVEMSKLISKHLEDKARYSQIYEYIHFVPVERKVTQSKNALNESSMSLQSSFSSISVFLIGIFVAFVFTFVF